MLFKGSGTRGSLLRGRDRGKSAVIPARCLGRQSQGASTHSSTRKFPQKAKCSNGFLGFLRTGSMLRHTPVAAVAALLGAIMIVPAAAQFGNIFNDLFG